MAIEYLGAKRLQGLKFDRINDSLGSSADGTNSGITLIQSATGGTDLTSSSQSWTQVGTEIVKTNDTITATSASDDDSSGSTGSDRVHTTLPSTLSNTKHTTEFDLKITGGGASGDPDIVPLMYTAGTTAFGGGSQDGYGFDIYSDSGSGTNYNMRLIARDGTDNDYSSGIVLSQNTQYYCRLVRNSADLGTLNVYSDSARTTHISGSPKTLTIASGSDRGKDCTHLQSSTWSGSNETSYVVENVKLYNNKVVGDVKLGTGAYSFDGSNDYVSFGSASDWKFLHDGTSNTIAFWVKRDGTQVANEPCVIDTQGASASYKGISFYWSNNTAGTLTYAVADGSGSDTKSVDCGTFTDGQWHHVAVTYDGTNITSYKDGVQRAQTSLSGHTPSTADPSYTLHAGRNTRGSTYYKGDVDDIGIYKRALSTTEIETLVNTTVRQGYNGGIGYNSATYTGGGGGGSGSAGSVGVSGTGGAGGNGLASSITGSSLTYGAGGGGGGTGATNGSAGSNTASNYGKGGSGSGSAGNAGVVIVAYTTASGISATGGSIDTSGRSGYKVHTFTSSGTFQITSGSGDVEYLVLGGGAGSGVDNYSAPRGFGGGGGGGILTGTKSSMSSGSYTVTIGSAGSAGSGNTDATNGGNSVFDNLTAYGGGAGSSHYNSQSGGQWGVIGNGATGGGSNNSPTFVGYAIHNTNTGALVSSLSNEVGLKAHYTMNAISGAPSGIAPDDGGNANSYSNVSVDSSNKKAGTGSYDFADGGVVGNSNQSYGISGTASWTISCWIRPHAVGGNEALFRKQHADGSSDFEFAVNSSNIFCWIEGNSTNMVSSPANNTWYHLVVRRVSGDKDYFYVNGAEVANTSTQNSIDDNSGFRWYLGRRKESGNETFNGNMDEWGIWNRALTTSEITALYNSGNGAKIDSISTTDLVIYWNFEQVPLAQQALPKCSNDASSTSELDGMTNLPVNTIFEQTDDSPKYYWKQSDGTWELDYHSKDAITHVSTGDGLFCGGGGSMTNNTSLATNYVWATNSANLPNNLAYSAGGGYKSSFQACGGYIASGSFFDSSTIWNGSAWAATVALDTQRRDTTAYGGSATSAVIALGRNNSGTEVDSSSKWDGTTWSSAGAVGSQVGEHVGGDGTDVSMLITGGSRGKEADKWNGSSWSATTALPQDTSSHNHAGKTSESAHVAGGNGAYAYDWDGTTWTSVTAITLGSDTTPRYVSGGGNKDHHWVMCGLDGGSSMNNCTLWNGSSWTAKGNMTEAQYAGLGDGTIR